MSKDNVFNDGQKNLEEVNLTTPENIHLNSFIFEPLIDIDIWALIDLYKKCKNFYMQSNLSNSV